VARIYRIDGIEVDPQQRCVRRNGELLHPRARSFDLLLYLIEQRDRVIPKEALFEHLWKGTAVTDNSLVQCVNDVRKALGDDARNPRFVRTVAKAGYQFMGPVEEMEAPEKAALLAAAPRSNARIWMMIAAAVAGLAGAALLGSRIPNLSSRRSVAVLPFENQSGAAELDWLREGLPDMLDTNLSRWPRLSVLSRQQVHDWAGRGTLKNRASIIVAGSFAKLGDQLRIGVEIQDARTGQLLGAESTIAERPEQIVSQLDLLASKIGVRLGVPAGPAMNRPSEGLSALMTSNLEAYRDYSLGVEAAQALRAAKAISLFEKAVALDPNFTMAEARIGYTYAVGWDRMDEGRPFLERAYRQADRLTEKDRLNITAWYAIANLDFMSAIRTYREMVAKYPDDVEAYIRLGELLIGERRYDEAIAALRQSLTVDPDSPAVHNSLHHAYALSGKLEASIAEAERYVALAPSDPNALDSLGNAYQVAERYAEAEASYRRALALDPGFYVAVAHLGNVFFQTGRYREAISQYEHDVQTAGWSGERTRSLSYLAGVYMRLGRVEKVRAVVPTQVSPDPGDYLYRLMLAVWQRDVRAADEILSQTAPILATRGRRVEPRAIPFARAQRALLAGKSEEAIADFKQVLGRPLAYWEPEWLEDCLGDAYLELGRWDDATAEYQRVLALHPAMGLARFHLAEAYHSKGAGARARVEYARFLEVWKNADADVPEIVAARKQLAAL